MDRRRVGPRCYFEVVFELRALSVENQIDASIYAPIPNPRVARDGRVPAPLLRSLKVAGLERKPIDRLQVRTLVGAQKSSANRAAFQKQVHARGGQAQRPTGQPAQVAVLGGGLAAVLLEPERLLVEEAGSKPGGAQSYRQDRQHQQKSGSHPLAVGYSTIFSIAPRGYARPGTSNARIATRTGG